MCVTSFKVQTLNQNSLNILQWLMNFVENAAAVSRLSGLRRNSRPGSAVAPLLVLPSRVFWATE